MSQAIFRGNKFRLRGSVYLHGNSPVSSACFPWHVRGEMNRDPIRHGKLHVNVTDHIPWGRVPSSGLGGTYTLITPSVPYFFRDEINRVILYRLPHGKLHVNVTDHIPWKESSFRGWALCILLSMNKSTFMIFQSQFIDEHSAHMRKHVYATLILSHIILSNT
jgi:hypothetical protein